MNPGYLIITGANGQLGSYLAKYPGLQGYPKLLLYHQRQDRLQELQDMPDTLLCSCDLNNFDRLQQVIKKANLHFGNPPAYLIHTAAIRSSDHMSVADCDPKQFYHTLTSNLMPALHILKAVLPHARHAGFGRLVFLTSVVTATGLANGAAYAAAKSAIANLVKSAALENAEKGILINCISPAPINTNLEEDYEGEYLAFRQQYFADYMAKSPTHKLIGMQELAAMCVLLINDALANLTGQEIYFNGGSN